MPAFDLSSGLRESCSIVVTQDTKILIRRSYACLGMAAPWCCSLIQNSS